MSENKTQQAPLLSVQHLRQYFGPTKAVDDISFDIYRGEVFGLVGESGCGKSTTGRSIIRLYDITGGSVYFDGTRIAAGWQNYKADVKKAKADAKAEVAAIHAEYQEKEAKAKDNPAQLEMLKIEKKEKLDAVSEKLNALVAEKTKEIKSAKHDHKYGNKDFTRHEVEKVRAKYEPLLEKERSDEEKAKLTKQYKEEVRLAKHDRIMNKIQMIFQDPIASLDPRMTVHDIIAEGLIIRGIRDKKFINEEVYRVLKLVGLVPEHATRYPHEFSGGQRQRIGIARAIVLNPDLIIADEPVSALDVSIQAQVINLLNDLRHQMNLTLLFIAHDLSVVKYFSDRIAVMYYGHIVELATSDELFAHPCHPYTKSLLSAIPLPDPRYEKKRKRIVYRPLIDHDYSKEGPTFREVAPGHFVSCNSEEFDRYEKEIAGK